MKLLKIQSYIVNPETGEIRHDNAQKDIENKTKFWYGDRFISREQYIDAAIKLNQPYKGTVSSEKLDKKAKYENLKKDLTEAGKKATVKSLKNHKIKPTKEIAETLCEPEMPLIVEASDVKRIDEVVVEGFDPSEPVVIDEPPAITSNETYPSRIIYSEAKPPNSMEDISKNWIKPEKGQPGYSEFRIEQKSDYEREVDNLVAKGRAIRSLVGLPDTIAIDPTKITDLFPKKRGRKKGYKASEATLKLMSESKTKQKYFVAGMEYESLKAAAKATGLHEQTIYARCKKGLFGCRIIVL